MIFSYLLNMQSHPSWVCGLKLYVWLALCKVIKVTPFVGVWIETADFCTCCYCSRSHPSWVCGLKHGLTCLTNNILKSHPSWVCGLKRVRLAVPLSATASHPSWVCGLKPMSWHKIWNAATSHPSWVCGLKHVENAPALSVFRHTLRGCVD